MPGSALPLDDAVATAATGDVWLFRGRSLADVAIRTLTNSPVNHVGMVVAIDDLPPLLWHAELASRCPTCGPASASAACSCTRCATRSRPGTSATTSAPGCASSSAATSRASTRTAWCRRSSASTAARSRRRPGLARQWLRGRYKRSPTALETIYCAELVATTYQAMGLLPRERPASWYDPGRFWSGDHIDLVEPFALEAEVAID